MPIRQMLDSNVFNPEEVTMLRCVFEDTLRALKLVDRSDPATSLIAKKIIARCRASDGAARSHSRQNAIAIIA